jgi:AraC-like DNA-binding protein
MFFISGVVLSFFLAALLLLKRQKQFSDWILFCWLVFTGIHIGSYYMFTSGILYQFPGLLGIALPFPTLHGPFLYLYVDAVLKQRKGLSRRQWLHFLPVALDYALLFPYLLLPAAEKISVYQQAGKGYEYFVYTNNVLISLSGIIYSLVTLYRLYQSYSGPVALLRSTRLWLISLAAFIVGIWTVVLLNFSDTYVFSMALLFVYYIGFAGISRAGVFSAPLPAMAAVAPAITVETDTTRVMSDPVSDTIAPKYAKSGLQEEAVDALHQSLVQLMQVEQPFKNADLTLADLAKTLNTHPNYLSQVINDKEGMNFNEYLNQKRLFTFQELALDPQKRQYTLLALAYESGFNSKSAFNRYFKKATGTSPSAWLMEKSGDSER